MRIGIEAQRLLRPHKHGMDYVALELIHALQTIDTDNDYFIFVRPGPDQACLRLDERFRLVQVAGLNYLHWEQIALPRAVRDYQLDVLHCTANTAPLRVATPLVLTLHDLFFLLPAAKTTATRYQRLGNRYRAWLLPRLLPHCQALLTVSHYARRQIQAQLGPLSVPVSVLYNGVGAVFQCDPTPAQRQATRHRYDLPPRYLLLLGSADPRKNMLNVLRAYHDYRQTGGDLPLIISGTKSAYLKRQLTAAEYQTVQQYGRFIGYIADEDLPSLYTLAEVFLFVSVSEGFGLPLLEAMACGTPVVTGNQTAMPEVAGQAALLVDPLAPQAIAGAIHQLLQQQAGYIHRGRARARQFDWLTTAWQLLEVYQRFDPAHPDRLAAGRGWLSSDPSTDHAQLGFDDPALSQVGCWTDH